MQKFEDTFLERRGIKFVTNASYSRLAMAEGDNSRLVDLSGITDGSDRLPFVYMDSLSGFDQVVHGMYGMPKAIEDEDKKESGVTTLRTWDATKNVELSSAPPVCSPPYPTPTLSLR